MEGAGSAEGHEQIAAGVEAALGAVGVAPEGRAYHPHVTLGRARGERSGVDARGDEGWGGLGTFRVEAIHLMRSELARGGARYATLGEHPLRDPAAPP